MELARNNDQLYYGYVGRLNKDGRVVGYLSLCIVRTIDSTQSRYGACL